MTSRDLSSNARARRRLQSPPPFTVFTLLFWIVVAYVGSAAILFAVLYALGLLEFRR